MAQIHVGLGERAYPIIIEGGLLDRVGGELKKRGLAKRFAVVSDSHVAELFAPRLMASLQAAGLPAELITFPRGEESKHLGTVAELSSRLAVLGFDRKDGLIALGGGVTGDITGFLASCYMRGIPFVQVPTTLLAQVDSSVGGKTGVDIPEGKNLVGAFYQPRAVYIDTEVLRGLPRVELLNGLAEVIKYGVIYDRDFFGYLEENREAILALDQGVMVEVIRTCCTIKARVVEADEQEADLRRILNFGHTIGHAIEGASGYTLAHGMAVAIGMVAAARIAVAMALLTNQEAERLQRLIAAFGMPTAIPAELDRKLVKSYLKTDKKAVGGVPVFVLPTGIGQVEMRADVTGAQIDAVLAG